MARKIQHHEEGTIQSAFDIEEIGHIMLSGSHLDRKRVELCQ